MTLLNMIGKIITTVLKTALTTEDYELHIVLTDRNNIVIYDDTKVFDEYTFADLHKLIGELKGIGYDELKKDEADQPQNALQPL